MTSKWDDEPGHARSYLERLGGVHEPADLTFIEDRAGAEAIELSAEEPGRIVCMSTHGRGALRWAMLGSVAEQVVRAAREPVVLVGRHCPLEWPNGFRTAIVCVDGSRADVPVISIAAEWSRALGIEEVHVATVQHPLDVESAVHSNAVVDEIVSSLNAEGIEARAVVMRAHAVSGALADHAASVPAPLLMTGSHDREGVARLALGSVSMGAVSSAPAPVVVVGTRQRLSAPGPE
jgi:nucleotide-binding universal stress UspA family protein